MFFVVLHNLALHVVVLGRNELEERQIAMVGVVLFHVVATLGCNRSDLGLGQCGRHRL